MSFSTFHVIYIISFYNSYGGCMKENKTKRLSTKEKKKRIQNSYINLKFNLDKIIQELNKNK